MEELTVPSELCRNKINDSTVVVDAAIRLIDHMCEHLGVPDLGASDVLDFGCGVRFTQAFLNRGVPIKHYVGVDVARDVIDFLRANVSDPRLEFFHLDAQNDLYNPDGRPLATMTVPEIEGRAFDIICLFSVFTHLAPDDYVSMLRLLRSYARPETKLFFTLFLNERTDGGYGYIDQLNRVISSADNPRMKHAVASGMAIREGVPDFRDAEPSKPLMVALYSRAHALELIEGTGWEVASVWPPNPDLQHHIVCTATAPS